MSATNAMSGISLVGSLIVAGSSAELTPSTLLGLIAVACSSTNVVGGFLITDRMLRMFKKEQDPTQRGRLHVNTIVLTALSVLFVGYLVVLASFPDLRRQALSFFYIISAVLFILGLKGLSSPKWARLGMFLAEFGMLMAVVGTLFDPAIVAYHWIGLGLLIGSIVGGLMGWWIAMTAVPQRTAFSHSLGALAATLIGISEYFWPRPGHELTRVLMTALGFEVVIGGLTFTGSLMAAGKLQGLLPGAPITYKCRTRAFGSTCSSGWRCCSGSCWSSPSGPRTCR
jgi:hypothetical protein